MLSPTRSHTRSCRCLDPRLKEMEQKAKAKEDRAQGRGCSDRNSSLSLSLFYIYIYNVGSFIQNPATIEDWRAGLHRVELGGQGGSGWKSKVDTGPASCGSIRASWLCRNMTRVSLCIFESEGVDIPQSKPHAPELSSSNTYTKSVPMYIYIYMCIYI